MINTYTNDNTKTITYKDPYEELDYQEFIYKQSTSISQFVAKNRNNNLLPHKVNNSKNKLQKKTINVFDFKDYIVEDNLNQ